MKNKSHVIEIKSLENIHKQLSGFTKLSQGMKLKEIYCFKNSIITK